MEVVDVDRHEVVKQVTRNYELANEALLMMWSDWSPSDIDLFVEQQEQHIKQIEERIYDEEHDTYDGYPITASMVNRFKIRVT